LLIDLHVHSTASDGTLSPSNLASKAKEKGISLLSLTDHDTTGGLKEFERACVVNKLAGLSGIELSAEHHCIVHILGYGFDYDDPLLQKALATIRMHRHERNVAICEKLRSLGVEITLEEVARESKGEVIARPHIAKVLLRKGYVSDIKEAFVKYLGRSAPAYVARKTLSPERCIALINNVKGLSVLAHPGEMRLTFDELEKLLEKLKSFGLWGLECYSSHHRAEDIFSFLKLADKFDLQPTAGSDFHGSIRPGFEMGIDVPNHMVPEELISLAEKNLGNSSGMCINIHSFFSYEPD